jgi:hypothetical protein
MNEIETLKQTIAALEKLISIKDQTILSLQSRPYYWNYQPYWNGQYINTAAGGGVTSGLFQQGANQQSSCIAQFATNTAGLCSVSGGQS